MDYDQHVALICNMCGRPIKDSKVYQKMLLPMKIWHQIDDEFLNTPLIYTNLLAAIRNSWYN